MDTFKDRLLAEQNELSGRISKLSSFLGTAAFEQLPDLQKVLLASQLTAMNSYNTILSLRIEHLEA